MELTVRLHIIPFFSSEHVIERKKTQIDTYQYSIRNKVTQFEMDAKKNLFFESKRIGQFFAQKPKKKTEKIRAKNSAQHSASFFLNWKSNQCVLIHHI